MRRRIRRLGIVGAVVGAVFALREYLFRRNDARFEDPQRTVG
jgi:hypothetical protein